MSSRVSSYLSSCRSRGLPVDSGVEGRLEALDRGECFMELDEVEAFHRGGRIGRGEKPEEPRESYEQKRKERHWKEWVEADLLAREVGSGSVLEGYPSMASHYSGGGYDSYL